MPHAPDVHLARLADPATMTTLAQLGFEWSASDAQTCAAVRFRRECREPPALVGLLGGASSGKSTLFNSLFEREISQISAHAHETKGPVVAVHVKDLPDVLAWSRAGTLLPGYGTIEIQSAAPTIGRPDATCLYGHSNDDFARRLVVDTPDVTSQSSLAEGSVARTLLPWFDDVIVVVDEERWFDATVFDELIEFSREFGPRLWVVFNQTDGSEALSAADQQRLIDHAINRHAAGSCISPYQPGSGYRPLSADTRRQTARWISSSEPGSRRESLERHLQRRCAEIVRVNVTRSERFAGLRRDVDRALVDLTTETSLSNDLLTPDEVSRHFARSDRLKRQLVIWAGYDPMILQRVEYFDTEGPHRAAFRGIV